MLDKLFLIAGKALRYIPEPVLEGLSRVVIRAFDGPTERDPEVRKRKLREAKNAADRRDRVH